MHLANIAEETRILLKIFVEYLTVYSAFYKPYQRYKTATIIKTNITYILWVLTTDAIWQEKPTNCGTMAADVLAYFLAGQL